MQSMTSMKENKMTPAQIYPGASPREWWARNAPFRRSAEVEKSALARGVISARHAVQTWEATVKRCTATTTTTD